jgi:prophage DNA circulation protein
MLPTGTTVGDLQAQLAAQRTAMMALSATLIVASTAFSATTDMMTPASALLEALRAGIVNPADQVRVMLNLATFAYIDGLNGGGIAGDMATVRDAMSEACRRAALVSLANASAAYQPVSYDDAINVRDEVVAALDVEILAAGDMGQDLTYSALIAVRAAIIQDLTTRGGSLPNVITVTLPAALPSLTIAQRLYQDASRSDQIAAEAGVPHPAFCPTVFQVLSR